METEDFEFSALSMGASYNHKVKISFDDGKVIDCDNENENEVIETISQYLINKGVFNK